jgi:hypothetical protein
MKTITTLAALAAALLSFNASAATPHTGRIDFSERAGIQLPSDVKYQTGRVDQGSNAGIYRKEGGKVTNGRQG